MSILVYLILLLGEFTVGCINMQEAKINGKRKTFVHDNKREKDEYSALLLVPPHFHIFTH